MRRPLALSISCLAFGLGLTACVSETAVEPAVAHKTLDYRNGWYHSATGSETLVAIAEKYGRDVRLVANLNKMDVTSSPGPQTPVYIPPVHDPDALKQILARVKAHPELIPTAPPGQKLLASAATANDPPASAPAKGAPAPTKGAKASIARADNRVHFNPNSVAWRAAEPADLAEVPDETESISVASVEPMLPSSFAREVRGGARAEPEPKPFIQASDHPIIATRAGGTGAFAWPVEGEVVEPFASSSGSLKGITIRTAHKTQVKASGSGKVIYAEAFEGYGKVVMIEHEKGCVTVYGYNESIKAKKGAKVKKGDAIAVAGKPTASSATQVFFQIRKGEKAIDPMKLLP